MKFELKHERVGASVKFELSQELVGKITSERLRSEYLAMSERTRENFTLIGGELIEVTEDTFSFDHVLLASIPSVQGKADYQTQVWLVSWNRKEPVIEIVEWSEKLSRITKHREMTSSVLDFEKVIENLKNKKIA
jgi:hypothetical protein